MRATIATVSSYLVELGENHTVTGDYEVRGRRGIALATKMLQIDGFIATVINYRLQ